MIFLLSVAALTLLTQRCNSELLQSHIVFRHGARTPVFEPFPNAVYKEPWPQGFGQLLPKGQKQLRELGISIRERYKGFLNDTYLKSELHVRSSDKDRALMSAQCVLSGLYSTQGWQPVPIHTKPTSDDPMMYTVGTNCPKLGPLLTKMNSPMNETQKKAAGQVLKLAGYEVKSDNRLYLFTIYDTIKVQRENNLPLPPWASGSVMEQLEDLIHTSLIKMYNGFDKSLTGGILLGNIIQRMQQKSKTNEGPKVALYSGHDVTLLAILDALSVELDTVPSYGAHVTVELHANDQNEKHVQVLYGNKFDKEPQKIDIPGCGDGCSLEEFLRVTGPNVGTEKDCEMGPKHSVTYDKSSENARGGLTAGALNAIVGVVAAVVASALTALVILVVLRVLNKRKRRDQRTRTEDPASRPLANRV